MADKVFPKGMFAMKPHERAPSFVKATVVITINDFFDWIETRNDLLVEYHGKKQMKFQITEGKEGKYSIAVDTFVPKPKEERTGTAEKQPKWDGKKDDFRVPDKDDGDPLPF